MMVGWLEVARSQLRLALSVTRPAFTSPTAVALRSSYEEIEKPLAGTNKPGMNKALRVAGSDSTPAG